MPFTQVAKRCVSRAFRTRLNVRIISEARVQYTVQCVYDVNVSHSKKMKKHLPRSHTSWRSLSHCLIQTGNISTNLYQNQSQSLGRKQRNEHTTVSVHHRMHGRCDLRPSCHGKPVIYSKPAITDFHLVQM